MRLLITGAGFSVHYGLPTTRGLLPAMKDFVMSVPSADKEHSTLGMFEPFLHQVADAGVDLENLLSALHNTDEDVRTALEDIIELHQALDRRDAEFYYKMLVGTLGWTFEQLKSPPDIHPYARILERFDGVITTNYDLIVEKALALLDKSVDYRVDKMQRVNQVRFNKPPQAHGVQVMGVGTQPVHDDDGLPLLKLHGSLNWAWCPACESPLEFPMSLPSTKVGIQFDSGRVNISRYAWSRTSAFNTGFHCGEMENPAGQSEEKLNWLVAPPVQNKETLPTWDVLRPVQSEAKALAEQADEALVIGSSVRGEDQALVSILEELRGADIEYIGGDEGAQRLRRLVGEVEVIGNFFPEAAGY